MDNLSVIEKINIDLIDSYKNIPHLRTLLSDKKRNSEFYTQYENILFDYTHQKIDKNTLIKLLNLYNAKDVKSKFLNMFAGEKINFTENRSVLHTSLRELNKDSKYFKPEVYDVLNKIKQFSNDIRKGNYLGFSNKLIKSIVCIGIGGSYLGTEFVYNALKDNLECREKSNGFILRFLANICPIDFKRAFDNLNPEETLIIIISKTFTTKETIINAETAKEWLLSKYPNNSNNQNDKHIISSHIAAVSTNLELTTKFGINNNNVFGFWDWVGGRYSVWSAVGAVPLSIIFGYNIFEMFLKGGNSIDHLLLNNLDINNINKNIPVLLGLLGYFNNRIAKVSSRAILPYCQALNKFVSHIQQLDMESNGKRIDNKSKILDFGNNEETGPIIFGEPGTNGQHSFYQLIHQGRDVVCEFIGYSKSQNEMKLSKIENDKYYTSNHEELMSNFFAQPDALAFGLFENEVSKNIDSNVIKHKTFPGDKSSLSLLFKELNSYTCGQLLSIYEHRVATEGFMYEINSFDQYGVELGKVNANNIRKIFHTINKNNSGNSEYYIFNNELDEINSATSNLIKKFYELKK